MSKKSAKKRQPVVKPAVQEAKSCRMAAQAPDPA